MLNTEEYTIALNLYSQGIKNYRENNRQKRFKKLLDYYNNLCDFNETEPNAIMHHEIALYGSDCENCGKPYRTKQASFCAACGNKKLNIDSK